MNLKRKKIYEKSDGVCWYCGEKLKARWHVDHFYPIKREPDGNSLHPERDVESNLVPSCASCNLLKSNMDIESFRWIISNFVTRLNRDITVYKHAKRYGLVQEKNAGVKFWFERNGRFVEI